MKTSAMIQSKYLKKEDFATPEVLTIRGIQIEEVDKSGETKWILYFAEKPKGLVMNVTKIRQLEAGFGDETDNWMGKKVKVSHDPTVMMGPQVVGGIKLTLPGGAVANGMARPPTSGVKPMTRPPQAASTSVADFDYDPATESDEF